MLRTIITSVGWGLAGGQVPRSLRTNPALTWRACQQLMKWLSGAERQALGTVSSSPAAVAPAGRSWGQDATPSSGAPRRPDERTKQHEPCEIQTIRKEKIRVWVRQPITPFSSHVPQREQRKGRRKSKEQDRSFPEQEHKSSKLTGPRTSTHD